MDKVTVALKVFFEEPFWIGVFERTEGGELSACRVVFGAEPRDYDVNSFIRSHYRQLRFSPPVAAAVKSEKRNPKRVMREAHKQTLETGIGTKSQQALKMQQEMQKTERRAKSRLEKEAEKERQFELKQQKRKEKHRGR